MQLRQRYYKILSTCSILKSRHKIEQSKKTQKLIAELQLKLYNLLVYTWRQLY